MGGDVVPDLGREQRIGLPEAVFCEGKSPSQIDTVLAATSGRLLLTRLAPDQYARLEGQASLDYDPLSRTAIRWACPKPSQPARVAVVTAGTSDLAVAAEVARTLHFHGEAAERYADIGVAGLWRLLERRDALAGHPIVIAVAGMEGALFSVLGGLIGSVIIAVPTSTGYGVSKGGRAALSTALASCAPGVLVVNIDNGYGAACAALRVLHAMG